MNAPEHLWAIHDSLAAELTERRQRAAVYLAISAALLTATVGAGLADAGRHYLVQDPALQTAYFLAVLYDTSLVLIAYVGLSPGLPWERFGLFEVIGWGANRLLGAAVVGVSRQRLQETYDREGVGYRTFLPRPPRGEVSRTEIRRLVLIGTVTDEVLAARIVGLSVQIHQYRLWRRFVTSASLVGLLFTIAALILGLVRATDPNWDVLTVASLLTIGALAVLTLLVRRTARTSPAW